jgi:hypothetical protein
MIPDQDVGEQEGRAIPVFDQNISDQTHGLLTSPVEKAARITKRGSAVRPLKY